MKTADLARKHGISEATVYNWKAKYGVMEVSDAKRLKALEKENAELKLYLVSVIRLLTAKGTLSRDELKAMVEAVDAEDGSLDGKYEGSVI